MARLKDIASRHNVNIPLDNKETIPSNNLETDNNKPIGKIRRPWMEDYETSVSKNTDIRHGLNPVLTESINPVSTLFKPSSNPVDKQGLIFDPKQGLNRVKDLRGNPLKVIIYLINSISKDEPYITEKVNVTDIANNAKISRESAKTALKFLKKFELITRLYSHTGVHGWTTYKIKKEIIDDFTKQGLNTVSTGAINSSSYINTTTIKTNNSEDIKITETKNDEQSKWDEIDTTPLEHIGFNKRVIQNIKGLNKNSPEIIQDSINQFSFGLKNNGDAKKYEKNARDVLIGVLKEGRAWIEKNYKSPREIEVEQFLARKKEERERIKKLEEEMIQYEFEEWLPTINESQRNEIVGELQQSHMYSDKVKESIAKTRLLEHFKKNIKVTAAL